ncbi:MAG: flavin reductase family protein [Phycisphaerae bacterium]|nr:flavin reductase family protein [Phycisphaerae bacterium]
MQIKARYEDARERMFPEQVAIVIAKDAEGKCNPISVSWTMMTSHEPPLMAISIGKTRHSLEVVRHAREFVISLPSSAMVDDVVFHGTKSGRDMDKLAECGTKTQPAARIDCVVLADAVANFECKLVSEHETGDHFIFVGEVVASHVNEDATVGRLYTLGNEQMGGVRPV